ncbi:transposase IS3/IS911 family protein [Alcanivorax sp. 521-1]|uniref:Transposase IS3/IS911 family protein n=1 Tax=Alloalcanivorax profundimaris TaxID=2735259 RepID=A0ABS0AWJ7_9GAMM|nr:transposase [Alloalcanivorax profundimaris]MBF5058496.1 transposase IS3/IS911 family protein [Alloalcanivorax profundimaris]
MKRYSPERKEAVLRKLAPPMSLTVPEVAEAEGISTASLYNWRRQAREQGEILPSRGSAPEQWSSEDKFRVVLETAAMNEAAFSAYCRERGLYPEQVEAWRASCMSANAKTGEHDAQSRQARKQEQKRVKKLERELRRKDKALAETAALLTLSKKAEAIWGRNDEDE